jgi:hypothetical protein
MTKISPPAIIQEGQISLSLPEMHTFDDWSNFGRRLCSGARAINWMIGDWLLSGMEQYGDKARDEANAIFRSDVERFAPIVDTCRRFAQGKRHAALTFSHHQAVMAIKDDGEADLMLTEAEEQRLTVAAVRAKVRVTTDRQSNMLPDDDPVDAASRLISQAWNRATVAAREDFLALANDANLGEIEL